MEGAMSSRNPSRGFYNPEMLASLDRAFSAAWTVLQTHDPFRDLAKENELRILLSQRLMALAADGVSDPDQLRELALESLPRSLR
jgi:hypothetical protein